MTRKCVRASFLVLALVGCFAEEDAVGAVNPPTVGAGDPGFARVVNLVKEGQIRRGLVVDSIYVANATAAIVELAVQLRSTLPMRDITVTASNPGWVARPPASKGALGMANSGTRLSRHLSSLSGGARATLQYQFPRPKDGNYEVVVNVRAKGDLLADGSRVEGGSDEVWWLVVDGIRASVVRALNPVRKDGTIDPGKLPGPKKQPDISAALGL